MQSLEKRISELEKSAVKDELPTIVIIRTLMPDDGRREEEIQELHDRMGYRHWIRQPGESEQELIDRASHEALGNSVTCALLMDGDLFEAGADAEHSARVREAVLPEPPREALESAVSK